VTFLDDSRARRTRPRHLGGRQLENRRRADLGDGGLLSATEIGVLGCPHWHIDYLRRYTRLEAVWYSSGARCEHECAAVIAGLPGAVVVLARFGSSDCGCETHRFWFGASPPGAPVDMLVWNCSPHFAGALH